MSDTKTPLTDALQNAFDKDNEADPIAAYCDMATHARVMEACYRSLELRCAELEAVQRAMGCGYCGATIFEYVTSAPADHERAIAAFVAHDAACERNPLARRIAELERIIEEAPHERHCPVTSMTDKRPCNCFKSRAKREGGG